MKVLVTSGATREPIDSVRFISNLSSGRTGAAICDALVARGIDVTHVHGVDSEVSIRVARREAFTDHASLDMALRRDRKITRLNSSHVTTSRMPSSA